VYDRFETNTVEGQCPLEAPSAAASPPAAAASPSPLRCFRLPIAVGGENGGERAFRGARVFAGLGFIVDGG
jgi:hypothetical protein